MASGLDLRPRLGLDAYGVPPSRHGQPLRPQLPRGLPGGHGHGRHRLLPDLDGRREGARALGRTGSDVLGPGGAGDALPSASWASRRETARRFSAPGGIVLGELTDPVRDSPRFAPDRRRSWGRQGRGRLITMDPTDGNGHVLVTSQASGYKSTGLVIPNILNYRGPLVVFDPKCGLYARTRKAREDMGFTPVAVDGRNGFDPARLIAPAACKQQASDPSCQRVVQVDTAKRPSAERSVGGLESGSESQGPTPSCRCRDGRANTQPHRLDRAWNRRH